MAIADVKTAYERVQAARNGKRPMGSYYIEHMIDDFVELHGDRRFGDDAAIVAGIGCLNHVPVTVIAMERGDTIEDRMKRNFGCPEPTYPVFSSINMVKVGATLPKNSFSV